MSAAPPRIEPHLTGLVLVVAALCWPLVLAWALAQALRDAFVWAVSASRATDGRRRRAAPDRCRPGLSGRIGR